ETRSEADQPEPLACADRLPFANERYNPPRHQPGDLDHADAPVWSRDPKRVSRVFFPPPGELGIDKDARPIRDPIDPPCHRTAVHVAVEYAHEYRDTRKRLFAGAELGGGQHLA